VEAVLRKEKSASWATADFEKAKEFFLSSASRLFALLVYLGHEELLDNFYSKRFNDDMFPIELVSIEEENDSDDQGQPGWTVKSTKNGNEIKYSGYGVTDRQIQSLCKLWQWQFFVPVFRVDNDNSIGPPFDQRCQMPFTKEMGTGHAAKTHFSVVRHFVMDLSHLEFSTDEYLVRNQSI
jgi:hypothetical protein